MKDKEKAINYFERGLQAYKSRNFALATNCFVEVTKLCPKEGNPWYNLGVALKRMGQKKEALEAFDKTLLKYEEAIKLDSKSKIAWYAKATALIEKWLILNDLVMYKEAIYALDKALELDPDFDIAHRCKERLEFKLALEDLKRKESNTTILYTTTD